MSSYRLHLDIKLGDDEERAIRLSKQFLETLEHAEEEMGLFYDSSPIDDISIHYRLGHDDDRQKSNYLAKNENGHVTNKKSRLILGQEVDANQQTFNFISSEEC